MFLLLHCPRSARDVLYMQKRLCNENITDCGGKTAVVLPADCPRSEGVGLCSRGLKNKKSKSRYSPGVGAVVTND